MKEFHKWECGDGKEYYTIECPYGKTGDRLWVREAFNWSTDSELLTGEKHHKCPERADWREDNVVWRADGEREHPDYGQALWKPSIFMPRWASRITLEIVSIQVERLQDISEVDAFAEGISGGDWLGDPIGEFAKLWNSINAKRGYGWDKNPYVWILEFKRIKP
jgi:hypothetical protein